VSQFLVIEIQYRIRIRTSRAWNLLSLTHPKRFICAS